MTRSIGSHAAHLSGRATRFARCLLLELLNGETVGITDHDRDLTIDIGTPSGPVTYYADTGILPSAIALAVGLEADNFEVSGPITARISRAAVLGGLFDMATAHLFDVRWDAIGDGIIPLMKGHVSGANVRGGAFWIEVRSVADRYNQTVGRVVSPYCSHEFGDSRCGYAVESEAATIATITDLLTFTVTLGGPAPPDGYFNLGLVQFNTGPLAGTRNVQVFKWTSGTQQIILDSPLPALALVGDTLTLFRGCGKTRDECKARSNILNFGGFPDVPGTDATMRYPVPKA